MSDVLNEVEVIASGFNRGDFPGALTSLDSVVRNAMAGHLANISLAVDGRGQEEDLVDTFVSSFGDCRPRHIHNAWKLLRDLRNVQGKTRAGGKIGCTSWHLLLEFLPMIEFLAEVQPGTSKTWNQAISSLREEYGTRSQRKTNTLPVSHSQRTGSLFKRGMILVEHGPLVYGEAVSRGIAADAESARGAAVEGDYAVAMFKLTSALHDAMVASNRRMFGGKYVEGDYLRTMGGYRNGDRSAVSPDDYFWTLEKWCRSWRGFVEHPGRARPGELLSPNMFTLIFQETIEHLHDLGVAGISGLAAGLPLGRDMVPPFPPTQAVIAQLDIAKGAFNVELDSTVGIRNAIRLLRSLDRHVATGDIVHSEFVILAGRSAAALCRSLTDEFGMVCACTECGNRAKLTSSVFAEPQQVLELASVLSRLPTLSATSVVSVAQAFSGWKTGRNAADLASRLFVCCSDACWLKLGLQFARCDWQVLSEFASGQ